MAGKRQHSIPRFLQKSFASKTVGDETFVWVHRKGQQASEINIKNVGVERNFYGKPGEQNIDPGITELEDKFSPLLHALRGQSGLVSESGIPDFIAHLTTRTRYLRKSFSDHAGVVMEGLHASLRDEKKIRAILERSIDSEQLVAILTSRGATPEFAENAAKLVAPHLPEFLVGNPGQGERDSGMIPNGVPG